MDELRPLRSRRSGFSIIEVMIALGMLAFGLLAMLSMQIHAMKSGKVGRHVTEAAQVARDRLEFFQRVSWTDPALAATGGWSLAADAVTSNVWVAAGTTVQEQTFNVDWRIADLAFDPSDPTDVVLKQIDVRVTWNEPGDPAGTAPRRYAATTRRFN